MTWLNNEGWLIPRQPTVNADLKFCNNCWRYKHIDLDLHRCKQTVRLFGKWQCHCPCLLRS